MADFNTKHVKVSYLQAWILDVLTLTPACFGAPQSDFGVDPVVQFHTCTTHCNVSLNTWLVNVLLEPVDFRQADIATVFDCWLHLQLLHTSGSYNTV